MFKTLVYTIHTNPEGVTNRRNVVLSQMAKGKSSQEEKKNYKVYRLN
jgi:membrane peptidoglycan carboxypeptidase